jgi:hypothetical protein
MIRIPFGEHHGKELTQLPSYIQYRLLSESRSLNDQEREALTRKVYEQLPSEARRYATRNPPVCEMYESIAWHFEGIHGPKPRISKATLAEAEEFLEEWSRWTTWAVDYAKNHI